MITGEFWNLHDDAALRRIDEAAVRLLERGGCVIEHEQLIGILGGAGCIVDKAARRCRIPERLVREAVARLGRDDIKTGAVQLAPGPERRVDVVLGGSQPHLLEWPACERRLATKDDIAYIAKMAHVLDEYEVVGRALACAEVPPAIEPLWTTLRIAELTDKRVGGGEVYSGKHVEYLVRMAEVLNGKPGDTALVAACDFFIPPLKMDTAQADCFLAKRRFGMPNVPGTMPISGISAPVTIAGTVTVAVAELLAGWVMGYAVNPDLYAGGIVASGSLDMRTTAACFGSPEAVLQDLAVQQLCRRLYGIWVSPAFNYVDAKTPGINAVWQKLFPFVTAPFGGPRRLICDGLLSAGQDYSPVQQLLEIEFQGAFQRFWRHFEVNVETIAEELTLTMLEKPATNFLDTEHTLNFFRSEQWYPRWLDRSAWQTRDFERDVEARMLENINKYIADAVARYQPASQGSEKLKELRRIVEAAKRECNLA